MPILTEDIKLLKSAVMSDVPEGGGPMTGVAVVDGQSNNLLPDTSAMDRAFGRVNARKLFGVAHTDDTDVLMGAHAMVTSAPADPLVHCTLIKTAGWSDKRATAQDNIEKYLVKGARLSFKLWDMHYTGSMTLKLVALPGITPPAGGDAIVLRNSDGTEQYVRILRITTGLQLLALIEGSNTTVVSMNVATCEIGNPLELDFYGPPANRGGIIEANYTQLYSTNPSIGARFYGIKPLGQAGAVGDYTAIVAGGIYTPVVPAATVESPLVDQYPLLTLPGFCVTASGTITTYNGDGSSTSRLWTAGGVVTLPTLIEPRSLSIVHAGVVFSDNGKGGLLQAGTVVGVVDYRAGTVTLLTTAPNYGYADTAVTYKPATGTGAQSFSDGRAVTLSNQGLVYVESLQPVPARGTFSLDYIAQGRWYTLSDDLDGKVAGAETSHGVGTIDYATGSVSVTLGAIPDIGSLLIYKWGEKRSGQAIATDQLPLAAYASVPLELGMTAPSSLTVAWKADGVPKTASVNSARQLSGDGATGMLKSASLIFTPTRFPDDNSLTLNWRNYANLSTGATAMGGLRFALTTTPVQAGSVLFKLNLAPPVDTEAVVPLVTVFDKGDGTVAVRSDVSGGYSTLIANAGTIDYATGIVQLTTTQISTWCKVTYRNSQSTWFGLSSRKWITTEYMQMPISFGNVISEATYWGGLGALQTKTVFADYQISMLVAAGNVLAVSDMAFTLGGELYTSKGGTLRKNWSVGAATFIGAGLVTGDGLISLIKLPANRLNTLVFRNAAINLASATINTGVFRTASAPLKPGVFQISDGATAAAQSDSAGTLSGSFTGYVDFLRGIVTWANLDTKPELLRYNAVFLQYLPLDKTLLGIDTVRLPLDGKVPIYRPGDLVVVHNTLTMTLPNPLVKSSVYSLGRERIASVRIKDAVGVTVPGSLYVAALNPGTVTFPATSDLTGYIQPLKIEHRIEDMMLCASADISGLLKFTRSLTHSFPAATSFVSTAMPFGDLFARAHTYIEQATWTGVWSNLLIGSAPLANYNEGLYPSIMTNRGSITERWAVIFTSNLAFKVVGESVGEIALSTTSLSTAPINPATGAPYFTIPALGWGTGWAAGNVLRFNTAASGAPFWVVRTILQGPASVESDVFSIAFRGDVDRP